MRLRISGRADKDLYQIFQHSLRTFGREQALKYKSEMLEAFEHLLSFPLSSRERPEFRGKVRIWHHRSHQIVYRAGKGEVVIVRVLHAHQEIKRHL